jgi:hypothetical protein
VEGDTEVQRRQEGLKRVLQGLEALLGVADDALGQAGALPADTSLVQLDRLRSQLTDNVQAYLDEQAAFSDYVRERMRMIEEATAQAAMSEKPAKSKARDAERIQKLSEELTRDLRLQRVDAAIKELLDFLSDAEFFAAQATTGRRRKLRTLQNAIEKALEK